MEYCRGEDEDLAGTSWYAFAPCFLFNYILPLISLACSYDDYVALFTPWLFHLIIGGSSVLFPLLVFHALMIPLLSFPVFSLLCSVCV